MILRGAGAAFCTGLDLKEAADQTKAHATAEMVGEHFDRDQPNDV